MSTNIQLPSSAASSSPALPSSGGQRTKSSSEGRLTFIDWTRGIAALIMLQGHSFHSLLNPGDRKGDVYTLSQFIGGMPAPIFLFLTGVTLSFLLDGRERRGVDPMGRFAAGLRRAGYLLLLALGVRLQAFLFAWPWARPDDILKVDVLNCMGISLALMAFTAFLTTTERVKSSFLIGVAISVLAPVVSGLPWDGSHPLLRAYLAPSTEVFGLFPWAAFTAFGVAFGSMLRLTSKPDLDRFMQWTCLAGLVMVVAASYIASLPYSVYRSSDFWLNSPALTFIKLGVILLVACFAYLWLSYLPSRNFSFVTLMGTSSLLVYWVHLEIVYGRWLWFWKEQLSVTETAIFSIGLMAAMVGLALAWRRRREVWAWMGTLRLPGRSPVPETESES
ncbi:MAG: DUF1624 domain-containing protein [Bryobacterales bacterium]|nr:DUF1624 domain-containing protein [Bryobacterales bacterium]